jgi:hypothetical protein
VHNSKQTYEQVHPTSFKNIALGGKSQMQKLPQKPVSNKPSQNLIRLELDEAEKSHEVSEHEQIYPPKNEQKQENIPQLQEPQQVID